jgi:hypothetical protein
VIDHLEMNCRNHISNLKPRETKEGKRVEKLNLKRG